MFPQVASVKNIYLYGKAVIVIYYFHWLWNAISMPTSEESITFVGKMVKT